MIFNKQYDNSNAGVIAVKILNRVTLTQFIVEDTRGRQFQVESDGNYTVGEFVIIKNGIIIGKSRRIKSIPNFVI